MTAVAARPIHGVPKSSPGVALTRDFTGEVFTFRADLPERGAAGEPPTG